jgi:hypothetical protein
MTETITSEPAGKRGRNGSVILTDRMCERRVTKRIKIYDRKCPGLYVSITTAGAATFSFKFRLRRDRILRRSPPASRVITERPPFALARL